MMVRKPGFQTSCPQHDLNLDETQQRDMCTQTYSLSTSFMVYNFTSCSLVSLPNSSSIILFFCLTTFGWETGCSPHSHHVPDRFNVSSDCNVRRMQFHNQPNWKRGGKHIALKKDAVILMLLVWKQAGCFCFDMMVEDWKEWGKIQQQRRRLTSRALFLGKSCNYSLIYYSEQLVKWRGTHAHTHTYIDT